MSAMSEDQQRPKCRWCLGPIAKGRRSPYCSDDHERVGEAFFLGGADVR